MNLLKWAVAIGVSALIVIAACMACMRFGVFSPSYQQVMATYGGAPTQYVKVGQVTLPIRDEGHGPVLIMMHSSMTNLREWDRWAERLKSHYRVIRMDWPPYGLSIDATEKYSMERAETLLEQFVDQSKLERFTLIGSSSGALICVLYAARHPERVDALALSTLPLAAPPPSRIDPRVAALLWMHKIFFPDYFPTIYYRLFLRGLFADPGKVTPALVNWYHDTNTIPGAQARIAQYLKADVATIWKKTGHDEAEKITAPVLLQWGDADPVLPAALGESAMTHLKNAHVTLIHYADAGHYPMLEIPERTASDLEAFLRTTYASNPSIASPHRDGGP